MRANHLLAELGQPQVLVARVLLAAKVERELAVGRPAQRIVLEVHQVRARAPAA